MPAEPLRSRLPRYLTAFAIGAGVAIGAGLAWGLAFDGSIGTGIGWALLLLGVPLLLAGGMTGGGFVGASTGDYGILYGRRHRHGQFATEGEILRYRDVRDRLRAGLRPGPNPAAFWQVVGGASYLALAVAVLTRWG